MEIRTSKTGDHVVVSISGRLDATNASSFDEQIKGILSDNPGKLIISLKGLEYVSSAGLRVFLAAAKEMKKTGGKIAFAEPSEPVSKVMKMSGLDTVLMICKTLDEAISSL